MSSIAYDNLPSCLFCGLIFNDSITLKSIFLDLEDAYEQKIDSISEIFHFDHSSYYKDELGENLKRVFVSFSRYIDPLEGPKSKLISQTLEKQHTKANKRQINIDPGLVSMHNLILYSTKNYAHRIPTIHGVYADLTYIFRTKDINFLPWTYPDFKNNDITSYFLNVRNKLKKTIL